MTLAESRVVHVNDSIPGAVYIGRPNPRRGLGRSPFANPYKLGAWHRDIDHPLRRADVVQLYEQMILASPRLLYRLPELRGKPLACWCRYDGEPQTTFNLCHGDVLVGLLERYDDDELRELAQGCPS